MSLKKKFADARKLKTYNALIAFIDDEDMAGLGDLLNKDPSIDLNYAPPGRYAPLHHTAMQETPHERMTHAMLILLNAGAEVNFVSNGYTPLMLAATAQRGPEKIKILIEQDGDYSIRGRNDEDAFSLAATYYKADNLQALFDHAVFINVNRRNPVTGRTALMRAAENGQPATVRLLIEKGAALDLAAPDGKTALGLAEEGQREDNAALIRDAMTAEQLSAERLRASRGYQPAQTEAEKRVARLRRLAPRRGLSPRS